MAFSESFGTDEADEETEGLVCAASPREEELGAEGLDALLAGMHVELLAVARSAAQNSASMSSKPSSFSCLPFFLFSGILRVVEDAVIGWHR
jgi:hypothetical protein